MKEVHFYFWLSNIEGIGPRKAKMLLDIFQNPEEIYYASASALSEVKGIFSKDIQAIQDSRDQQKIRSDFHELEKKGIRFISMAHSEYPKKLFEIYDPPIGLYVKGQMPNPNKYTIGIVGARECTQYGRQIAHRFANQLSDYSVQVVSGLAKGIDGAAHRGALLGETNTFAVLGSSVDVCYPSVHGSLYGEIEKKGGIISEYPIGTPIHPGNFPMRNRIISGMSDGILIVEAREKSGSLITIDMGLDQGKDVFAIPGRIGDELSVGTNQLIKIGANLVSSVEDILDYYQIPWEQNGKKSKKSNIFLETTEKIVYANLRREPKYIDELVESTKLSISEVTIALLGLERKTLCVQMMKNYYMISE